MSKLQTTTITNQNISTSLLVGAFVATKEYPDLLVKIFADQISGGGDYKVYITHQLAGTGSEYKSAITTDTLGAGETSHLFQSSLISVNVDDIVKVYLLGLVGDTTTPDITCEFWDLGYLRATVPERTLDVTDTGAAGIDWGNIENKGSANEFSDTSVSNTQSVNSIPADTITFADNSTLQEHIPATAVDVWSSPTRTLSSFGTLVSDVWTYLTRTLTSTVAGVTPQQIWEYSMRTLTSNPITSPPGSAITSYLTQEPGKMDVTMKKGDDLSFDVDLGVDLTLYDLAAWIDPILDGVDIPIVITNTDLVTGKLHFYISDTSVKDLPIVSNKHRWGFKLLTPKANTNPTTVYTRTILYGYFNLT